MTILVDFHCWVVGFMISRRFDFMLIHLGPVALRIRIGR